MKNNNSMKTLRYTFLIVLTCVLFFTCKKKHDDECPVCPSVESISPTSARAYDKLTIFGKNFSVTTKANIVKINGVQVNPDSILSGNASQLIVKVPRSCGSGPVTVDLDNELTNFGTPPVFTYNFRYITTDFGVSLTPLNPPSCIGGFAFVTSNYVEPMGIVADFSGNIYFSDSFKNCIYKLDATNNHDSCIWAGSPNQEGSNDALGTQASFRNPGQMYIDNNNTIFVSENSTHIRTISPSGNVATYATDTNLNYTTGIAFQAGNSTTCYASVTSDHIISKITRQGAKLVTTIFAGKKGNGGYADGIGTAAKFLNPQDVVVDNSGNVFVSDQNNVIRKITPAGVVTTFAGSGSPIFADGQGTKASFNQPRGMFLDTDNSIYVADSENNCIRKITPDATVSTLFTFTPSMNTPKPNGITRDRNGNFYITYRAGNGNGIKKLSIF